MNIPARDLRPRDVITAAPASQPLDGEAWVHAVERRRDGAVVIHYAPCYRSIPTRVLVLSEWQHVDVFRTPL